MPIWIQQNKGALGSPSGGGKRHCCVNPIRIIGFSKNAVLRDLSLSTIYLSVCTHNLTSVRCLRTLVECLRNAKKYYIL